MLIALELQDRNVTVVGSSEETTRRALALSEAGARVRVIAPSPCASLIQLATNRPHIELLERPPSESDADDTWLIVIADRNQDWVQLLGPRAADRRTFFCAIDQPGLNTFSHVAVAQAGDLTVGISTKGRAPGLAAALRRELERLFERSRLAQVVEHVAQLRASSPPPRRSSVVKTFCESLRIVGTIESALDSRPPENAMPAHGDEDESTGARTKAP